MPKEKLDSELGLELDPEPGVGTKVNNETEAKVDPNEDPAPIKKVVKKKSGVKKRVVKKRTTAKDVIKTPKTPRVVKARRKTVRKNNNLIKDLMDTAQQPGIVRGVLILGGVLIALSCAGILYVFLSEKSYTTMSPSAQNKMIVSSLVVESSLSSEQNVGVVQSLALPASANATATATATNSGANERAIENASIINSLK